jgi:hypothetical protein
LEERIRGAWDYYHAKVRINDDSFQSSVMLKDSFKQAIASLIPQPQEEVEKKERYENAIKSIPCTMFSSLDEIPQIIETSLQIASGYNPPNSKPNQDKKEK